MPAAVAMHKETAISLALKGWIVIGFLTVQD